MIDERAQHIDSNHETPGSAARTAHMTPPASMQAMVEEDTAPAL